MSINGAMRQKLASYGVWTYRSAWALEIVAACIGLATGLVLGLQAYNANANAVATDLVLASAPFFMVALAELTKIPIATLLFSTNWLWKPILLILLLLLALITFETVFMGLERATTLRQLKYQKLVKEKQSIELQHQNSKTTADAIQKENPVSKAQQNIESINKLSEGERQSITEKIAQVDRELEGQVVLTPEAARVRDRLKEEEERRAVKVDERDKETKTAFTRFQSQRDSYTTRLDGPSVTPEQRNLWTKQLDKLVNPVTAIEERYRGEVDAIEASIKALRLEFDELRKNLASTSGSLRASLEKRREDLLKSLEESDMKWSSQKDVARGSLSDAQSREFEQTKTLSDLRTEQQTLREKIAGIEDQRITLAREDQVQRIAGRFYGKNPEDVGPDEANFIAIIWFGSLAALAALAGPITAIVALGLQRIGLADAADMTGSKLSRLLRRLILAWRWRRTRTKIRNVEVPVEKEVIRTVKEEVPVEKIIKEILYVPILTDDPEAVRRSLYSALPKEVADIVKVTLAGKVSQSGSPA